VLQCGCGQHPVLDGIPILMRGRIGFFEHTQGDVQYPGPDVEEVLHLVSAGRALDALLLCIAVPNRPVWFEKIRPRRMWRTRPVLELMARIRRRQMRSRCTADPSTFTGEEWMDAFFGESSCLSGDLFSYFFYRYAQPRHLATLALTSVFPAGQKPLLDLACGFGHLGHSFNHAGLAVVGTDRNFMQLWAAQYCVAPGNRFVCSDADQKLPFADDSFSGTLCSDAFHYFRDKSTTLREIARCAPETPLLLARVGNVLVQPNEGFELSPKSYTELLDSRPWEVYGETELLDAYLRRKPIRSEAARNPSRVDTEKWLYLLQSGTAMPSVFGAWPHGIGQLAFNPIYRSVTASDGSVRLTFRFPSAYYAFENGQMTGYHPAEVTVDAATVQAVRANQRTPEVMLLVDQMVVLGLPAQYRSN
jgi:SAM-dependent methyltransferase